MTLRGTPSSGSSKPPQSGRFNARPGRPVPPPALPKVLAYPKFYSLAATLPHLRDRLCYLIRHYGTAGLSVLIVRQPKNDKVAVLCGDWDGNNIDLVDTTETELMKAALVFIKEDLKLFLQTMHTIKLPQAQFFFALDADAKLTLVDIQTSLSKFAGPGFVRDLFGKVYQTQEILKIEALDGRALEYLERGTGTYSGDIIIKPSKFAMANVTPTAPLAPLYTELLRT